jgi:hypothetical protein
MKILTVNIRAQRERFNQLLDAMKKHEKVEGYYVLEYTEFEEMGGNYAKFTLRSAVWQGTLFWRLITR